MPDFRITKLVGYSERDVKSIMNHVKCNEDIIWELAREKMLSGKSLKKRRVKL